MNFKIGEKVYCKSMDANLVIAQKEGEYAYTCINTNNCIPNSIKFDIYVLSAHDLESGWKEKNCNIEPDYIIQQEVLNEYIWNIMSKLLNFLSQNKISIDDKNNPLVSIYWYLAEYQGSIVSVENNIQNKLDKIDGFLNNMNEILSKIIDKE